MAHETALWVADRMETGQALSIENRLSYVNEIYTDANDGKIAQCCANGMLFVGTYVYRGGSPGTVVAGFERYKNLPQFCSRGRRDGTPKIIATYVEVPEHLAYKIEDLHVCGATCTEIIGMLRRGELDEFCV